MSEFGAVNLIALAACLVLAASAAASFRLGWAESVRLLLVWGGIFAAVFLIISMIIG
ncbi:MAG: hypothetical protein ACEQR8_07355 [Cypionkella sp.]